MFAAHVAIALLFAAAYRGAPPLWLLVVAALAADIALALLTLAHLEHLAIVPGFTLVSPFDLYDAPGSHSLIGSLGLAAMVALGVRQAGYGTDGAWIAGAVAATHWPLDWLVLPPILTVAGSGALHGLGLYDHPLIAMPAELTLLVAGLVAYLNATRERSWRGRAALATLAGGLLAMQLALWLRPPAVMADPAPANVAWSALALYVVGGVFAWWCDRTRERR